jgi:hypothetical protein
MGSSHHAQPILHFFCRPCGEYHEKVHPHYAEQQARAAQRAQERTAAAKPKAKTAKAKK